MLRASKTSKGFLERLVPITIGNLDADATRDALEIPFAEAGRRIQPGALHLLADATNGYPYAVQWAGYHTWERAADSSVVNLDHVNSAIALMEQSLEATIYASRWQDISRTDRSYLLAAARLAASTGSASTADIAAALGKAPSDVTRNRDRLINKHHVLQPGGHGRVEFTVPGLADWLVNRHGQQAADARRRNTRSDRTETGRGRSLS